MTDKSELYRASEPADTPEDCIVLEDSVPPNSSANAPHQFATDLLETIEAEILPRLVLVHSNGSSLTRKPVNGARIESENLDEFVDVMIDQSGTSGREMVDDFIRKGVTQESVYLDLLAPAARRMGEMWENDIRNFTDVTIGLCRLHEVLRHNTLSPNYQHVLPAPESPSILLSTACGDQHVFGVIMVAEFFRKEGWHVTSEPGASTLELSRIVAQHNFDAIGLSIACSMQPETVSEAIELLRTSSRNPAVKIILGGALIERDPSFAMRVGADTSLADAANAPAKVTSILATARVGC